MTYSLSRVAETPRRGAYFDAVVTVTPCALSSAEASVSFLTPVLFGSVCSAVVSDLVSLRRAAAAPLRKEPASSLQPVDELAVRRRERRRAA